MTPVLTSEVAGSVAEEMTKALPLLEIGPDEWTRRMMRWHFSDETGAPFWLDYAGALGFDPLRDVQCRADLRKFGTFDIGRLRRAQVRDLLPRGFAGRPFRVFETGGTTGPPCAIVNVTRLEQDVLMYAAMLRVRGLAGLDIIAMTPSGPHAYGHFVEGLADSWCGAVHAIDFDPRWVKAELRAGRDPAGYVAHLLSQVKQLLARQAAGLIFTTSKLLLALAADIEHPLADYGIRAVCTGGSSCTAEEERYLRREFLGDVAWLDTYGNTLVGHALPAERGAPGHRGLGCPQGALCPPVSAPPAGRGELRSYHLAPPFGEIRVTDPADWTTQVAMGCRGQVVTTTLLEDLFIPNLRERDTAVRTPPHPDFPWEGVAQVRPAVGSPAESAEGVY